MKQDSALDSLSQQLPITKDNQDQFYETTAFSPFRAERQISRAEERGRERMVREKRRVRRLKQAVFGLLAVLVCAALAAVLLR